MIISLITGILLPVYLYTLLGTGAITLTLLNCIGILLITGLSVSVLITIIALNTPKRVK
jgi:hypothetical protein